MLVTYIYSDNSKYEGELLDGKKNGKGTCFFPNGDKYIGNWVNGKMQGEGIKC